MPRRTLRRRGAKRAHTKKRRHTRGGWTPRHQQIVTRRKRAANLTNIATQRAREAVASLSNRPMSGLDILRHASITDAELIQLFKDIRVPTIPTKEILPIFDLTDEEKKKLTPSYNYSSYINDISIHFKIFIRNKIKELVNQVINHLSQKYSILANNALKRAINQVTCASLNRLSHNSAIPPDVQKQLDECNGNIAPQQDEEKTHKENIINDEIIRLRYEVCNKLVDILRTRTQSGIYGMDTLYNTYIRISTGARPPSEASIIDTAIEEYIQSRVNMNNIPFLGREYRIIINKPTDSEKTERDLLRKQGKQISKLFVDNIENETRIRSMDMIIPYIVEEVMLLIIESSYKYLKTFENKPKTDEIKQLERSVVDTYNYQKIIFNTMINVHCKALSKLHKLTLCSKLDTKIDHLKDIEAGKGIAWHEDLESAYIFGDAATAKKIITSGPSAR